MDYLLCGNLPYPAWKKHIFVQNLSNRRIRRYLVCRLKRPEARDFSHVRFTGISLSEGASLNALNYGSGWYWREDTAVIVSVPKLEKTEIHVVYKEQ